MPPESISIEEFRQRMDDVTDVVCRALMVSFPMGEAPPIVASALVNVAMGTLMEGGFSEANAKELLVEHLQSSFAQMEAIPIRNDS